MYKCTKKLTTRTSSWFANRAIQPIALFAVDPCTTSFSLYSCTFCTMLRCHLFNNHFKIEKIVIVHINIIAIGLVYQVFRNRLIIVDDCLQDTRECMITCYTASVEAFCYKLGVEVFPYVRNPTNNIGVSRRAQVLLLRERLFIVDVPVGPTLMKSFFQ